MSKNQMTITKIIAKFLRSQRRSKDLTQHELADLVGIKRPNYASYELSGRISTEIFTKIMLKLDFSFVDFENFVKGWMKEESQRLEKERQDLALRKMLQETDEITGKYSSKNESLLDEYYKD